VDNPVVWTSLCLLLYICLLKSCQDAALEHHVRIYESDNEIRRTTEIKVSSLCVFVDKSVN